jgi:oxygen-independent coproporphyrinogen-3 oxidase
MSTPVHHLYVHVPFCTHLCPYCAFYKTKNVSAEMRGFIPALGRELEHVRKEHRLEPRTVFWGGGTPSALSVSHFEEIAAFWPWPEAEEFTLEANPLTISGAKAKILRRLGVNRLSLGVQSFDPTILQTLGRTHRPDEVRGNVRALRRDGFANLNIDLMFSVPGQTFASWKQTLEDAVACGPDHLSCYNLNFEEDTDFFLRMQRGEFRADAGQDAEFFLHAVEFLARHGYEQIEISNFARPGFSCIHNEAYWRGADYLGLGPSACSTVGLERWTNVHDTAAWMEGVNAAGQSPRTAERLTPEIRRYERIMLGLRTTRGVALEELRGFPEICAQLREEGLAELDGERLRLTPKGRLVADNVSELFLAPSSQF